MYADSLSNREDEASSSTAHPSGNDHIRRSMSENSAKPLSYLNDPESYNYHQINVPINNCPAQAEASTSNGYVRNKQAETVFPQPTNDNLEQGSSDEVEIIDITEDSVINPQIYNKMVKKYSCRYCGLVYSCASSRWQHENNKHREKAMMSKLHKKNVLEERRQGKIGYQCHYCTGSFDSYQTRYAHEKSKHETLFERRREATLNRRAEKQQQHRPGTSTEEFPTPNRKWRCSMCPMKFGQKNHLKMHLMKHNTERPWICQPCGRSFKANTHLKKHLSACLSHLINVNIVNQSVHQPANIVPDATSTNAQAAKPNLDAKTTNNSANTDEQREEAAFDPTAEPELNSQDERAPDITATCHNPTKDNVTVNNEDIGVKEEKIIHAEPSPEWQQNVEPPDAEPVEPTNEEQIQESDNSPSSNNNDETRSQNLGGKNIHLMDKEEGKSTTKTFTTSNQIDHIVFDALLSEDRDNIEKTGMPLSAVICTSAAENKDEMIVVYLRELEIDLVSAAHSFTDRCMIVVENLNIFNLTEKIYQHVKGFDPQMVNVTLQKPLESSSIWSVITFNGNTLPPQLNNRLFQNISEMEELLASFALTKGLKMTNVIRYDKDGFYQYLSKRLTGKTVACNCTG